jgi:hypothetical protein
MWCAGVSGDFWFDPNSALEFAPFKDITETPRSIQTTPAFLSTFELFEHRHQCRFPQQTAHVLSSEKAPSQTSMQSDSSSGYVPMPFDTMWSVK